MNENIGDLIKLKRKELGMTQEELASILFVSNKTISKWETKKGYPSGEFLVPLSETLKISLEELLKNEETYEELLIKEIKKKKKEHTVKLISSIIICLILCFIDVMLYIVGANTLITTSIFISIFLILIIVDIVEYLNKKN